MFRLFLIALVTLGLFTTSCTPASQGQSPNTWEAPMPATAFGNAMGVSTHFNRTTGVYSPGFAFKNGADPIALMKALPVNHYRVNYTVSSTFDSTLATIAANNGPKADFIVDIRRNCTTPPVSEVTANWTPTYTSLTVSPMIIQAGTPTVLTATLCFPDTADKTLPAFTGVVNFYQDSTPIGSAAPNSNGVATMTINGLTGPHYFTAWYAPGSGSPWGASHSDCLQTNTVAGGLNCQAPQRPALPTGCIAGNGAAIYTDANNNPAIVTTHHDLLGNSKTGSRDALTQLAAQFAHLNTQMSYVGYIEAPNEYDNNHNDQSYNNTVWKSDLANFLEQMYHEKSNYSTTVGTVPFIGPSMGNFAHTQSDSGSPLNYNNLCKGSLAYLVCFDYGNTHAYPRPDPSTNMIAGIQTAWSIAGASNLVFQTESGYENAAQFTATTSVPYIDQATSALYGPRLLAEYLYTRKTALGVQPGISLMNYYELLDEDGGPNCQDNAEDNFGLINVDTSQSPPALQPKPIYYALQRALADMVDTNTTHTLPNTNYYFSSTGGTVAAQHLLFRKAGSSGHWMLILWQETPLWNYSAGQNGAPITVPAATVETYIPGLTHARYHRPSSDAAGAWHALPNSNGQTPFQFSVTGEITIVEMW